MIATNGVVDRPVPRARLYRDHPNTPVAFKTTFRVDGDRGVNVRFLTAHGRLYLMLAGNVMEYAGGRDTVLNHLTNHVVMMDYVNALRIIPAPGDMVHAGLFTPIEAFEALDRVAANPDLVRGLKRVRQIAARNLALNAPTASATPEPDPPRAPTPAPEPPPASRLDALREAARAKAAAERRSGPTDADRLAALQEAVLEAYTRPTADGQLEALRVVAESLF